MSTVAEAFREAAEKITVNSSDCIWTATLAPMARRHLSLMLGERALQSHFKVASIEGVWAIHDAIHLNDRVTWIKHHLREIANELESENA